MPKTHTDTAHAAVSLTKRELQSHYADVVDAVIKQYLDIMSLHPVVANNVDQDEKPSKKLSFEMLNYKIDIERATERALRDAVTHVPGTSVQPLKDRLDLQATWFGMALNHPVDPALRAEVIWRCGRLYAARSLQPWRYWERTR